MLIFFFGLRFPLSSVVEVLTEILYRGEKFQIQCKHTYYILPRLGHLSNDSTLETKYQTNASQFLIEHVS
jgi:hypothetical protein